MLCLLFLSSILSVNTADGTRIAESIAHINTHIRGPNKLANISQATHTTMTMNSMAKGIAKDIVENKYASFTDGQDVGTILDVAIFEGEKQKTHVAAASFFRIETKNTSKEEKDAIAENEIFKQVEAIPINSIAYTWLKLKELDSIGFGFAHGDRESCVYIVILYYFLKADTEEKRRDFEETLEIFNNILTTFPGNPRNLSPTLSLLAKEIAITKLNSSSTLPSQQTGYIRKIDYSASRVELTGVVTGTTEKEKKDLLNRAITFVKASNEPQEIVPLESGAYKISNVDSSLLLNSKLLGVSMFIESGSVAIAFVYMPINGMYTWNEPDTDDMNKLFAEINIRRKQEGNIIPASLDTQNQFTARDLAVGLIQQEEIELKSFNRNGISPPNKTLMRFVPENKEKSTPNMFVDKGLPLVGFGVDDSGEKKYSATFFKLTSEKTHSQILEKIISEIRTLFSDTLKRNTTEYAYEQLRTNLKFSLLRKGTSMSFLSLSQLIRDTGRGVGYIVMQSHSSAIKFAVLVTSRSPHFMHKKDGSFLKVQESRKQLGLEIPLDNDPNILTDIGDNIATVFLNQNFCKTGTKNGNGYAVGKAGFEFSFFCSARTRSPDANLPRLHVTNLASGWTDIKDGNATARALIPILSETCNADLALVQNIMSQYSYNQLYSKNPLPLIMGIGEKENDSLAVYLTRRQTLFTGIRRDIEKMRGTIDAMPIDLGLDIFAEQIAAEVMDSKDTNYEGSYIGKSYTLKFRKTTFNTTDTRSTETSNIPTSSEEKAKFLENALVELLNSIKKEANYTSEKPGLRKCSSAQNINSKQAHPHDWANKSTSNNDTRTVGALRRAHSEDLTIENRELNMQKMNFEFIKIGDRIFKSGFTHEDVEQLKITPSVGIFAKVNEDTKTTVAVIACRISLDNILENHIKEIQKMRTDVSAEALRKSDEIRLAAGTLAKDISTQKTMTSGFLTGKKYSASFLRISRSDLWNHTSRSEGTDFLTFHEIAISMLVRNIKRAGEFALSQAASKPCWYPVGNQSPEIQLTQIYDGISIADSVQLLSPSTRDFALVVEDNGIELVVVILTSPPLENMPLTVINSLRKRDNYLPLQVDNSIMSNPIAKSAQISKPEGHEEIGDFHVISHSVPFNYNPEEPPFRTMALLSLIQHYFFCKNICNETCVTLYNILTAPTVVVISFIVTLNETGEGATAALIIDKKPGIYFKELQVQSNLSLNWKKLSPSLCVLAKSLAIEMISTNVEGFGFYEGHSAVVVRAKNMSEMKLIMKLMLTGLALTPTQKFCTKETSKADSKFLVVDNASSVVSHGILTSRSIEEIGIGVAEMPPGLIAAFVHQKLPVNEICILATQIFRNSVIRSNKNNIYAPSKENILHSKFRNAQEVAAGILSLQDMETGIGFGYASDFAASFQIYEHDGPALVESVKLNDTQMLADIFGLITKISGWESPTGVKNTSQWRPLNGLQNRRETFTIMELGAEVSQRHFMEFDELAVRLANQITDHHWEGKENFGVAFGPNIVAVFAHRLTPDLFEDSLVKTFDKILISQKEATQKRAIAKSESIALNSHEFLLGRNNISGATLNILISMCGTTEVGFSKLKLQNNRVGVILFHRPFFFRETIPIFKPKGILYFQESAYSTMLSLLASEIAAALLNGITPNWLCGAGKILGGEVSGNRGFIYFRTNSVISNTVKMDKMLAQYIQGIKARGEGSEAALKRYPPGSPLLLDAGRTIQFEYSDLFVNITESKSELGFGWASSPASESIFVIVIGTDMK